MKFFIWNDNSETAQNWEVCINTCLRIPKKIVRRNSSHDPEEVASAANDFRPDFVILDVLLQGTTERQTIGGKIAKFIRNFDPLVPIIAVTEIPGEVYKLACPPRDLGFDAVYSNTIMNPRHFYESCLQPVLNESNARYPDLILVRNCTNQLAEFSCNSNYGDSFKIIRDAIMVLPFLGNRDTWHARICKNIKYAMDKRGLVRLSEKFADISNLFREGDPLYMASSESRKHLSHDVQVFLLGLHIFLGNSRVRMHGIAQIRGDRQNAPNDEILIDCIFAWAAVALTHDIAYFPQEIHALALKIDTVFGRFKTLDASYLDHSSVVKCFSSVKKIHHSVIGSRFWRSGVDRETYEGRLIGLVADGIERHDSSQFSGAPVKVENWISFLAVLCDELQDWGRDRTEHQPANRLFAGRVWENFYLNNIDVSEAGGCDRLVLDFVGVDFPEVVAPLVGQVALDSIEERFSQTIGILRKNLFLNFRFSVELKMTAPNRGHTVAFGGNGYEFTTY